MKNSAPLILLTVITALCWTLLPAISFPGSGTGQSEFSGAAVQNGNYYQGAGVVMGPDAPDSWPNGKAKTTNQKQETEEVGLGTMTGGKTSMGSLPGNVPADAIKVNWPQGLREAFKKTSVKADGQLPSNAETQVYLANFAANLAATVNAPDKQMHAAKSNLDSQAMEMANALADLEKQQAASAIDFCSSFLTNFTTDSGNKWNKLRDTIFVPMAILLLLPGAVLTQVKSIVAAGTPVLGDANPFEGIQRAIIAIFLIPGTYLVLNYSIDLNNSITFSIAEQYQQTFGTNMYRDALAFHIRAFPARQPGENRNALDQQSAKMGPLLNGKTAFARFEGMMIENKIEDPVAGIYLAPADRADEALPAPVIAAKEMFNSTNCTFMIAWNILCAFQMIYFYYLWFVGPITAALWAWPMKNLRGAFPSWCEGVITLGFWSLFWNTSILLMACFRGVDETGTLVITALNFLATSSVKYAFDFAGLAKAAGQEAASMADKAMKASQKGGGGGKSGGGGASHSSGGKSHSSGHSSGTHGGHTPSRVAAGVEGGGEGVRLASGGAPGADSGSERPRLMLASYGGEEGEGPVSTRGLMPASLSSGDLSTAGSTISDVKLPPSSTGSGHPDQAITGFADPDAPRVAAGGFAPPPVEGGSAVIPPAAALSRLVADNPVQPIQFSFDPHAVAAGSGQVSSHSLHATHVNGQAAVQLMGQHGLSVGADGKSFFAMNQDGDNVQIQFAADGKATLPDGTVVQATNVDNGVDLSVFDNGVSNPASDNFLIRSNCDMLAVAHSDAQHHALEAMTMKSNSNGDMQAQAYDSHGRKSYGEDVHGNLLRTTNYDPQTNAVSGYSVSQPANNGTLTSYYDKDSAPVGATLSQISDYGTSQTTYDAAGRALSIEQDIYNADGSSSITNANFAADGSVYNAQVSNFDLNGQFVSSVPMESRYAAALAADVIAIGHVPPMASFDRVSNSDVCLAGDIPSGGFKSILDNNNNSSVLADNKAVIPDGNLFATSVTTIAAAEASFAPALSQNVEVGNSYATPVVTSSVDVVPPISFDSSVSNYTSADSDTNTYAAVESSNYAHSATSEYSRQTADPGTTAPVRIDQDVNNVQASDAAQRIAFDAAPTSYQPVDQSVDQSASYVSASSSSSSFSSMPLQYQPAPAPTLMDQVMSAKNDSAYRAVEAHNIAAEVRSHLVPQESSQMVGSTGLSHQVQAQAHQVEYYAAPSVTNQSHEVEFNAAPVTHQYQPDQVTQTRTPDTAQRIAFDSSPVSYQTTDQSVDYSARQEAPSVDYTSQLTTYHNQPASTLMEQVQATRKESAYQAVEEYNKASEIRAQIAPMPVVNRDSNQGLVYGIALAASQRRALPTVDQSSKKINSQSGVLNSILDSKLNKKKAPPQEVASKNQTSLVSPTQQPAPVAQNTSRATEVPMFLDKMRDTVDDKMAIEPTVAGQITDSLERQMIDSSNHMQAMPGSAFSSALGRANAAKNNAAGSAEHLTNALIDYHTISSLIHAGKVHEAQQVASYALDNISKCSGREPQLLPLVNAFVTLFQQTNMSVQATAFAEKEHTFISQLSTAAPAGVARNIWGA